MAKAKLEGVYKPTYFQQFDHWEYVAARTKVSFRIAFFYFDECKFEDVDVIGVAHVSISHYVFFSFDECRFEEQILGFGFCLAVVLVVIVVVVVVVVVVVHRNFR